MVTVVINNICEPSGCDSSEKIKVIISNLKNPMNYFADNTDLGNISMITYYKINDKEYKVDTIKSTISSNMLTLKSSTLNLLSLTSSSL